MVSEIARADEPTRRALARAVDARARELARESPRRRGSEAPQRALATLAMCVGGLALARAMRGHSASDELLAACRKMGSSAPPPPRDEKPSAKPGNNAISL